MFYKQTPVKITGNGLAAGCQVFYRKIYGFFIVHVCLRKQFQKQSSSIRMNRVNTVTIFECSPFGAIVPYCDKTLHEVIVYYESL